MNFKKNFKRFFTMSRSAEGFTLVELIVVIAILGILVGVGMPAYSGYIDKANEGVDEHNLAMMNNALVVACVYVGVEPADAGLSTNDMVWNGNTFMGLGTGIATASEGETATTTKDDVVALFNSNLGQPIEFKKYTSADIKLENGAFVGPNGTGGSGTTVDGGKYVGAFNSVKDSISSSVSTFQGSNFNQVGATDLMLKVDNVTGIASEIFKAGGNLSAGLLNSVLSDPSGLYTYFGLTGENATMDKLTEKLQGLSQQENADLMANYAVLQAAKNTTSTQAAGWLADLKTNAADSDKALVNATDIKAMMSSTDAATAQDGMSKAAMMYAMYTAYTQTLTGDAKAEAEANTKDISSFINNVNTDAGFRAYLQGDSASTDMNGYLAALDIINKSTASNTDATNDLLANGFADENLAFALEGLLGTSK